MYKISDIKQIYGISKNQIYTCISLGLPISHTLIKNYRVFNDNDLEIIKYYIEFGDLKAIEKYGVSDSRGEVIKEHNIPKINNTSNNNDELDSLKINDLIESKLQDVLKEYESKIDNLNNVISIKDDQVQKYALLKSEEKKEKEIFITKYEEQRTKNEDLIRKYYNLRSYLLILICIIVIMFILLIINYYHVN